ncbi:MAG: chaperonin cofactor prefoldin [Verrucomicrobiales bacterium]|jgi:chaperonin cofactor prefoldin
MTVWLDCGESAFLFCQKCEWNPCGVMKMMTDIRFNCFACDQKLKIRSDLQGQTVPCPACDADLVVPSLETSCQSAKPSAAHTEELEKRLQLQGVEIQRLEKELSRMNTEIYRQRSHSKASVQPSAKGRQNEALQRRVDALIKELEEKNKALRDAMFRIQQFEAQIRELSGEQSEFKKLVTRAPAITARESLATFVKQVEHNMHSVDLSELLDLPVHPNS